MMYSSDDEYQSPAAIRQFGAKRPREEMEKSVADDENFVYTPNPNDSLIASPPAPKRRRVTYSEAYKQKGTVVSKKRSITEFRLGTIHRVLKLLAKKHNKDTIVLNTTTKPDSKTGTGKKPKNHTLRLRWSEPAIIAIASVLEMKIRRLLEVSRKAMDSKVKTITGESIAKGLDILGESQGLRGLKFYDAEVVKKMAKAKIEEAKNRGKKFDVSERSLVITKIKSLRDSSWDKNVEDNEAMQPAHHLFTPRVLNWFFGGLGVKRASEEGIRRILAFYTTNILTNYILRIYPLLVLAKKCTVTLQEIEACKDTSASTVTVGFHSMGRDKRKDTKRSADLKERLKDMKQKKAEKAAQKEVESQAIAALEAMSGGLPTPAQ